MFFLRRILRWPGHHKLLSLVSLLFLMLVLRLIWGRFVHHQLQSQLQAIRARGEPIMPSDVVHQPIPDDENAAFFVRKAAGTLVEGIDSPRASNLQYPDYLPHPPEWMKLAEACEKAQAPAFALARAARQRERAQFATSFSVDPDLRHLTHISTLAKALCDAAEYSHLSGNDTEALERLLDVLHISRTLQHDDLFISYLV